MHSYVGGFIMRGSTEWVEGKQLRMEQSNKHAHDGAFMAPACVKKSSASLGTDLVIKPS